MSDRKPLTADELVILEQSLPHFSSISIDEAFRLLDSIETRDAEIKRLKMDIHLERCDYEIEEWPQWKRDALNIRTERETLKAERDQAREEVDRLRKALQTVLPLAQAANQGIFNGAWFPATSQYFDVVNRALGDQGSES